MTKIREHSVEQRSYIRYLVKSGMTGYRIRQKLSEIYGSKAMSKSSVYKWVNRFSEGRDGISDESRTGRPATTHTEKNVQRIKKLLNENENISLRKIATQLNLSKGATIRMVSKNIRKNAETNICFMCLSKEDNLNIIKKTHKNMQQLIYIMPELTSSDTKTGIHVCETCHKAINSFYYFKKMCLENSKQWKQISKTNEQNKTQTQKSLDSKQNTTTQPNIKTETNIEEIETVIKQENEIDATIKQENEIVSDKPEIVIKCEPQLSDDDLDGDTVQSESETNDDQWAGTCVLCNRLFTNESLFRRHFRMHSEVRNYKCDKCSKCFMNKTNLKRHIRSHSTEMYARKKFFCPGCNSGFVRRLNLRKHMRNVCVKVPLDDEMNI